MASSKRGYLTISELEEYADLSVTDSTEAYDQISHAEELIDDYVGVQQKAIRQTLSGIVSAVPSSTTFTLESHQLSSFSFTDYFKGMHVEIVGGTGAGQLRKITGSTDEGVLTIESAFTTAIDTTSAYKISQMGKFPRAEDVFINSRQSPTTYYKSIPENVKRATAAQVEYMIEMGSSFFASNGEETSETIGDYSVSRKSGGGIKSLIAPKARHLLRYIMNRGGEIVV